MTALISKASGTNLLYIKRSVPIYAAK